MKTAREWYESGKFEDIESIRAIQADALETAAELCDTVDAHGPTTDECAAEAAHAIRKLRSWLL